MQIQVFPRLVNLEECFTPRNAYASKIPAFFENNEADDKTKWTMRNLRCVA